MRSYNVALLKSLALKIGLLLAALMISSLILEGSVRLFLPRYASMLTDRAAWQYHPTFGWLTRPDIDTVLHFDSDEPIPIRTNSLGFRDDEVKIEKQPGTTRIVLLGDSFAFGYGVREEDRVSEIIANEGEELECVNLGVSGYSTDQELLVFREVGRSLSPDIVVLIFVSNDGVYNPRETAYGFSKPRFVEKGGDLELTNVPVPQGRGILRLRRALVLRSALFNLANYQYRSHVERLYTRSNVTRPAPGPSGSLPGNEITRRLLLELRDEVEAAGARFLVVIAASGANLSLSEPMNSVVEQWCRETGTECVETRDAFRAAAAARPSTNLFLGDRHHWTGDGHRIAAQRILETMTELEWIPRF